MENVSAENVRQNMNPQNQNQQGTGELEQGTTEPEIFNKIDMFTVFYSYILECTTVHVFNFKLVS